VKDAGLKGASRVKP